jgi:hypothetical protein
MQKRLTARVCEAESGCHRWLDTGLAEAGRSTPAVVGRRRIDWLAAKSPLSIAPAIHHDAARSARPRASPSALA